MARRTQKDIRQLVEYASGESIEDSRFGRLQRHGWVDNDELTETGTAIVKLTEALQSRDKFDAILGMMGVPEYIGIAEQWSVHTALYKIAALKSVKAVIDEIVESSIDNFGLVEGADPIRHIGYRDMQQSEAVIREAIQLTVEPEAGVLRRIEQELEDKGYVCVRHADGRTTDGKSTYRTEIYGLDDEEEGHEARRKRNYVGAR